VGRHPEVLTERFQTARQQGPLRRLSQTNLPGASETVTISIPPEELNRTRSLAAKRGLRYQTYLKMLLHEALDAEEKSSLVDFGVCPDAQRVSAISQAS
jgi:predicted DNA binding CopG/RHH family protein